ncbi:MAG TPA: cupin domain-containing protein [Salinarimonas sp.]|nr:cupin domain-containing protein [Salinarimonas sp.]
MTSQVIARGPDDCETFRIKAADTNRMTLLADPVRDGVPFTALVEIFDEGGRTPPNTHAQAYEMFYVLAGEGVATCGDVSRPLRRGDMVLVPPGHEHVIENTGPGRLYCLTIMVPDEGFADLIRSGLPQALDAVDRAALAGAPARHGPALA